MSEVLERIVARIAARLAAMLAESDAALVHAPREFCPVEIVPAALNLLGGANSYRRFPVRTARDVIIVRRGMAGHRPLLVEWTEADPEVGAQLEDLMAELLVPGTQVPAAIVVAEADCDPLDGRLGAFDLKIGPTGLLVTEADLEVIAPETASDVVWRHEVLRATGGVPVLVAAALEDALVPEGGSQHASQPHGGMLTVVATRRAFVRRAQEPGETRLTLAAQAWASRAFQRVRNDPLRLLHAWTVPLSERDMRVFASEVLGREITLEQVREARSYSAIFSGDSTPVSFPPVLCAEIIRLAAVTDASKATRLRSAIAQVISSPDLPMTGLDRIAVCTRLGAWSTLDALLASEMPVLALTTSRQRAALAAIWPTQVPPEFPFLPAARSWVCGSETPPSLPVPWTDLLQLLSAADPDLLNPEFVTIRDTLLRETADVQGSSVSTARAAMAEGARWLATLAASFYDEAAHTTDVSPRFADELCVLATALMGAADGCLSMASIADAQACVNRAVSLCELAGADLDRAPALRLGLVARSALLATIAGVHDRGRSQINLYESYVARIGSRDPEPERVVRIARRYLLQTASPVSSVLPDAAPGTRFTPYEIEAEALVMLLQRGPAAAYQWIQAFINRSRRSGSQSFEWWPLHGVLALIDVREGRHQMAQKWLDGGTVPAELALVVQAGIELNLGRHDSATVLVSRVAEMPTSLDRWRLLARGVRDGAQRGPGSSAVQGPATEVREWEASPSALALLPAGCREIVLPLLDAETASLPGLRTQGGSGQAPARDVVLTPRQKDVLRGLERGGTLAQVADDLYLGVETVRSTAKALYKRLGVHDRTRAVETARTLGLLS